MTTRHGRLAFYLHLPLYSSPIVDFSHGNKMMEECDWEQRQLYCLTCIEIDSLDQDENDTTEHSFEEGLAKLTQEQTEDRDKSELDEICNDSTATNRTRNKSAAICHCTQLEDWDCGVACIQMILRWLRSNEPLHPQQVVADRTNSTHHHWEETLHLSSSEMLERNAILQFLETQSIWTIDLVMLLEKIRCPSCCEDDDNSAAIPDFFPNDVVDSFSYLFCSNKLGVAEDYRNFHFYEQSFQQDSIRVTRYFEHAIQLKLPVLQVRQLSFERIIQCVSKHPHVIALFLVDNRVLRHGNEIHGPYSGHYVLLCGISYDPTHVSQAIEECPLHPTDLQQDTAVTDTVLSYCLVLKNPALDCGTQFVMPRHLEYAWKSNGTDEDIIFIAKKS